MTGRAICGLVLAGLVSFFWWSSSTSSQLRTDVLLALGVPAVNPPWSDLQVISSAIRERERGGNPIVSNSSDPLKRPFNYPRLWLSLKFLREGDGVSRYMVFQGILALVGFGAVLGRIPTSTGVMVAILLMSPSVLLLIERGNTDLTIFGLCAFGVVLLSRERWAWCGAALFAAASVSKLYPLAAMAALAIISQNRVRNLILLAGGLAALGVAIDWRFTIQAVRTTQTGWLSYGTLISAHSVALRMRSLFEWFPVWLFVLRVLVLAVFSLCLYLGLAKGPREAAIEGAVLHNFGLIVAASIYLLTFEFGSFDYRIVFLFLAVPFVVTGATSSVLRWVWWLSLIGFCWSSAAYGSFAVVIHLLCSWLLLLLLGYWSGVVCRRASYLKKIEHRDPMVASHGSD